MKSNSNTTTIPLYEKVKRQISEAILEGQWAAGDVLPGEVALAQQFEVAVGTIRRALADLTTDGMLTRRQRIGTVVTGRMPQHSIRLYYQFFRLQRADGALVRSKPRVLRVDRIAARAELADRFKIENDGPLLCIHRVRDVDGIPVMHERILLPLARIPDFPLVPRKVPDLLYLHFMEEYGIRISAVRETLSAESASKEDSKHLKLPPRHAVLLVEAKAYDQSGQLFIVSQHRANTTSFRYVNEVR